MTMNPWLAEQLVSSRREDLARESQMPRVGGSASPEPTEPHREHRSRPALVRHMGAFLIAAGYRLTGTEGWQAAFDQGHRS